MTKEQAWERLMRWSENFDGSRDVTDEARRWADAEAETVARPDDVGSWKASVETSFDAGRMYERMLRERPL